jgi:glycogen debranching enzyme
MDLPDDHVATAGAQAGEEARQTHEESRDEPLAAELPAGEPSIPGRLFALKHQNLFVVADSQGDIVGQGDGLFWDDTRILSRFRLTIAGRMPSLLGARLSQDNVAFTSHMANRPLPPLGEASLPEGVIHIERQRLLWNDCLFERIELTNFASHATSVPLELTLDADFRDIFEVRGMMRVARGTIGTPDVRDDRLAFQYFGRDGRTRQSIIRFSEPPVSCKDGVVRFAMELTRNRSSRLHVTIGPDGLHAPSEAAWRQARAKAHRAMRLTLRRGGIVRSSNPVFDQWLGKSRADLALLTSSFSTGPYPCAGIPWFSTPFGRDGIITALQMLWLDPSLARGVLGFLAAHQARDYSAFRDSAPGKIMHETRNGEMAALGEVPFGLYYGGVDSTPLFVVLAGAYAERTGDHAFIAQLWPALEAAMRWIETDGDSNRDGLLDYARARDSGLTNQGWKDSIDSVFHADGSDPAEPIALVEVQGYVCAAWSAMARLCAARGDERGRDEALRKAAKMRWLIEDRFWLDDEGFYALAIDGDARPCAVKSSNMGHLLYMGVPSPERAARVADELMGAPFANGWGIRTLAKGESRYNPMSYHNGSVWPHDTAIAAAGLARYGRRDDVLRLCTDLFAAAVQFDMRLPELFCGFARRGVGDAPVGYPVACMPQAWASGSAFMMLQAMLGISIHCRDGLRIEKPRLPPGIDQLRITNIEILGERDTLTFQRIGDHVIAYSDRHLGGAVPIAQT